MAPDWARALAPLDPTLRALDAALEERRRRGELVLPERGNIMRAFARPMAEVKVLVVGQDPYPTPGHSIGLCFAVDASVRPLPRSLNNIFRELVEDTGVPQPAHGDLSAWADQGVFLLNPVLTVAAGQTGSHRSLGWQRITTAAVTALVNRGAPLVSILWGREAQKLAPMLEGTAVIESAHPSPLSARRGFFGSRPFSRANELLVAQGATPIDWSLPPSSAGTTGASGTGEAAGSGPRHTQGNG